MAVLGSPRKLGNSTMLARRFLELARQSNAKTRSFFLEELSYKGCRACGACKKTSERCVIDDDLSPVLEAMYTADIIVFATPNYFADVSGQFKLFLDRTYSLLKPEFLGSMDKSRLPAGKHLVFILSQGGPDSAFKDIPEKYSRLKLYFNLAGYHVIHGGNLFDCDEVAGRPELIKKVDSLAGLLMR